MKLVVVESPSKIKKVGKYLGNGYKVLASAGHIIDLPKKEIGIDTNNYFRPKYTPVKGKTKTISYLKKAFNKADELIIATDLDREGEAIGWHVARETGAIKKTNKNIEYGEKPVKRIVFSEITKEAINKAIESPRELDKDLIDAQQTRRVLDRLVGYKLSPLLWKKIDTGLSAGRVQSVALRIVVDRELEIKNFDPKEYWNIYLKPVKEERNYLEVKTYKDGGNINKPSFTLEVENKIRKASTAKKVLEELENSEFFVKKVTKEEKKKKPKPPFITSTLQQEASKNKNFKWKSKKTMQVAQKLYEKGFITYMRTDSTNLSKEALSMVREVIKKDFSTEYLPEKSHSYKSGNKTSQEAHEAIRPTKFSNEDFSDLNNEEMMLYELIKKRAIASQMKPAIYAKTEILIKSSQGDFKGNGSVIVFDGFTKLTPINSKDRVLPDFEEGEQVYPEKLFGLQNFTKPPSRYTEAKLIKKLEKVEVGRPSTYSNIIDTIEGRKYVKRDKKGFFVPEEIAFVIIDFLKEHFSKIVDIKFTAELENELDQIASGHNTYLKVLSEFYEDFNSKIEEKKENISSDKYSQKEKTDKRCPECGGKMTVHRGKYGKFAGCDKYPECKGTINLEKQEKKKKKVTLPKRFLDEAPEDTEGNEMVLRKKSGSYFWASKNFDLKETQPVYLKEKCPECKNYLVERKGKYGKFLGCSNYPKCKYIKDEKKKK